MPAIALPSQFHYLRRNKWTSKQRKIHMLANWSDSLFTQTGNELNSQFHGEKKFNSITVAAFTKIMTAFFRCSIIVLLILCNASCIAAPWGSGLMNAFNRMLLHTWNIPVISGGRQRGSRRTATTHVAGNGTQKYEVACSQVRHCTRSRATFRPKPNVRKLSITATGTTCYANIFSISSIGCYCTQKLLIFFLITS